MLPHGLVAGEVLSLHRGRAAGRGGARCGLLVGPGAGSGRPGLDEGAPADLVVYADDPRADLRALAHPWLVVLRGRIVLAA